MWAFPIHSRVFSFCTKSFAKSMVWKITYPYVDSAFCLSTHGKSFTFFESRLLISEMGPTIPTLPKAKRMSFYKIACWTAPCGVFWKDFFKFKPSELSNLSTKEGYAVGCENCFSKRLEMFGFGSWEAVVYSEPPVLLHICVVARGRNFIQKLKMREILCIEWDLQDSWQKDVISSRIH